MVIELSTDLKWGSLWRET